MNLDDAMVEDTFWWVCPECERVQTSLAGDSMICCECDVEFEPDHFDWEASNRLLESFWIDNSELE